MGVVTYWAFDDGGREAAGFRGSAGDCVTRAIAIGTGLPYREVYDALHERYRERPDRRKTRAGNPRSTSPRDGLPRRIYEPFLLALGWRWTPTMAIGSGCTVHLRPHELPDGTIIARCSRHVVAVIDGIVHDTFDSTRDGTRCVYGYYEPPLPGEVAWPEGATRYPEPGEG